FQDGRRRIDVDVVVEIAQALGLPDQRRDEWAVRVRSARTAQEGAEIAVALRELPRPTSAFVGRTAELGRIDAALATGLVWVTGIPGSGKTQTALRAAETAGGPAPVFLDMRGQRAEA